MPYGRVHLGAPEDADLYHELGVRRLSAAQHPQDAGTAAAAAAAAGSVARACADPPSAPLPVSAISAASTSPHAAPRSSPRYRPTPPPSRQKRWWPSRRTRGRPAPRARLSTRAGCTSRTSSIATTRARQTASVRSIRPGCSCCCRSRGPFTRANAPLPCRLDPIGRRSQKVGLHHERKPRRRGAHAAGGLRRLLRQPQGGKGRQLGGDRRTQVSKQPQLQVQDEAGGDVTIFSNELPKVYLSNTCGPCSGSA